MKNNGFFKEDFMNRKIIGGVMVTFFLGCILFSGCVGFVDFREMDLTTNIRSAQILNLRNYGDADIDSLRQSEKLMKNGFLDTKGEEYGYYQLDYSTKNLTSISDWAMIQTFSLYTLAFIGVPTDSGRFRVNAGLKIYDSNGVLVKDYQKTGYFTQTAGLYYGHNPTKRAEKELQELFEEIQQMANLQSGEINQNLLTVGPITREKNAVAVERIASYSKSSNNASTPSYSYSGGSDSGNSTSGSSGTDVGRAIAEAFKSPLQSGTYALAGNSQAKIYVTGIAKSGVLSYTNREGRRGAASYTIDGNRMTIQMDGRTLSYIVNSETSFSGAGEIWVREGF
ncbi:MAG: hypothetical protein LBB48_08735 [Treponema sp.]|jgi:hypothetical protein|nr:hypothetical protein [Treponema sp.]